jgi:hypothetical protein
MTHLDTSNTSYGQKNGHESNWLFDSRLVKVRNLPNFLMCKWRATYHWIALNEGYNFPSNLISIEGLHIKLWTPKVAGVPTLGILKLPLESPGTKWHINASLVVRHRVYYKGEASGFPQVWAMVSLVSLWLPLARPCTKMLQLCINQFVVRFVQVHVSNWITCQSS